MNTLGEDDLGGHVKMKSFGAHFRVDMTKKVPTLCVGARWYTGCAVAVMWK